MTSSKIRWSRKDEKTLRKLRKEGSDFDHISLVLGRTVSSVKNKCQVLGSPKPRKSPVSTSSTSAKGRKSNWTKTEDNLLKSMVEDGRTGEEISLALGRPAKVVSGRKTTLTRNGSFKAGVRIKRSANKSAKTRYISQQLTAKSTPAKKTVSIMPKSQTLGEAMDKVMAEARRNGVKMSFTVTME